MEMSGRYHTILLCGCGREGAQTLLFVARLYIRIFFYIKVDVSCKCDRVARDEERRRQLRRVIIFFLALWPVDHHRPTNLRQYRYLVPYGTTIVPYHPPYRWPHAIISYHTIATPQSAQCRRTLPALSPWDPVAWGSPSSCTIPFFFCSWPRSSLRCDNTKTLVTRF